MKKQVDEQEPSADWGGGLLELQAVLGKSKSKVEPEKKREITRSEDKSCILCTYKSFNTKNFRKTYILML